MQVTASEGISKVSLKEIQTQLGRCPSLPSLGCINKSLQNPLLMEQRYAAQIAEIIRRSRASRR